MFPAASWGEIDRAKARNGKYVDQVEIVEKTIIMMLTLTSIRWLDKLMKLFKHIMQRNSVNRRLQKVKKGEKLYWIKNDFNQQTLLKFIEVGCCLWLYMMPYLQIMQVVPMCILLDSTALPTWYCSVIIIIAKPYFDYLWWYYHRFWFSV